MNAILDLLSIVISLVSGVKVNLRKKDKAPGMPAPDKKPVRPVPSVPPGKKFKLSARSRKELIGVNPKLVRVVERAIELTPVDFGVYDGKRSAAEQNKFYKAGNSQLDGYNNKSYHQSGNAVDLVPYVYGNYKWDWERIYRIAAAMTMAAKEQRVATHIRWGGVWDSRLSQLIAKPGSLKKAVRGYCDRHPGSDFIDGPHFEWRD